MSSEPIKSWNRPWTTQEIVDNASNWSLAGDAGLLNCLESFSEDLISKATATNDNLNKLLDDLGSASLALDTVKNEFFSLRNTQFIESRVYEDDETLPTPKEPEQAQQENVDDKSSEEAKLQDMKEAVARGIAVVEKYYEKVEVPASDSEDETDFPSFVLNPRDPYIDRPLPYVIGTHEWHTKWHVGLLDTSSESEPDNVSENFSESDSEDNLPVQNRAQTKKMSNSGSETDLSNRMHMNRPVANSTFDESVKQMNILDSSDSDENNSVPTQAPISNKSFARELAAKLGNVIEQNPQIVEPEINKRPIQNVPAPTRAIGNVFCDEPPPLDDDDDEELFGNKEQRGLFSGGGGLFDDLDEDNDDSLWKEEEKVTDKKLPELVGATPKSKLPNLFDDEDDYIFNAATPQSRSGASGDNSSPRKATEPKKISGGLFDDEDNAEDDLFSEFAKPQPSTKPYLRSGNKTALPYFDDEPPELKSPPAKPNDNLISKKPIGGIKVFGNADLFGQQKIGDILRNRRRESTESSDTGDNVTPRSVSKSPERAALFSDTIDRPEEAAQVKGDKPKLEPEAGPKPQKISLFDDENDGGLFENDLFSNMSTKKFTSSLFDDKPLHDDLFDASTNKESTKTAVKDALLAHVSTAEVKQAMTDNVSVKSEVSDNISSSETKPVSNDDSREPPELKKKPKTLSLFDDDDDDEGSDKDDLFAKSLLLTQKKSDGIAKKKPQEPLEVSLKTTDSVLEPTKEIPTSSRNTTATHSSININLFDQNPPELDDEWDTKSDNMFDENEPALFDNLSEISGQRSGLFDNEPPSLFDNGPPSLFSESSGIVPDFSARIESDDSFIPYASSSRRLSHDIFTEQQSNDSFFVTKSMLSLEPQNLDSIPEIADSRKTDNSHLEITPSGNVDDLLSDSTVVDAQLPEERARVDDDKLTSSHFENPLTSSKSGTGEINGSIVEGKPKGKPVIAKKPVIVEEKEEGDEGDGDVHNLLAPKMGSPGKLRHNLQINVQALMPGVSPPKKKELEKSHSLEVASTDEDSITRLSIKSVPVHHVHSKSDEELSRASAEKKAANIENSASVEPEVLHSITKDRVRIPIKRRPSTRKGRQESLRKSAVLDLTIDVATDDKMEETKEADAPEKPTESDISDRKQSTIKSDRTERSVIETEKSEPKIERSMPEPEQMTTETSPKQPTIEPITKQMKFEDLFGVENDEDDDDDDLFSSNTAKKSTKSLFDEPQPSKTFETVPQRPKETKTETQSTESTMFGGQKRSVINSDSFESEDYKKDDLFDDAEEFGDIFSSKKLPPKSNILKKSLFDDELDDDDDIFGPSSSNAAAKNAVVTKAPERKLPKSSLVRKLENSEVVEDPLSLFNDPELT